MENFKLKLLTLINDHFNINIFGPNGCGKTTFLLNLINLELSYIISISLKLHNFINIKEFFEITSDAITNYLDNYRQHSKYSLKNFYKEFVIKNWNDLYSNLELIQKIKTAKIFIIDGIDDLETFLFFKKEIQKLLAIVETYKTINVIFISNFDMTKSELKIFMDFSNFIPLNFPKIEKNYLIEIIEKKYFKEGMNKNNFNKLINFTLPQFQFPFLNLNEYFFNLNQIFQLFNKYLFSNDEENLDYNELKNLINNQILRTPIHFDNINIFKKKKNLTESLSFSQKVLLLSSFLANNISPNNDLNIFKKVSYNNKRKTKKNNNMNKGLNLKYKSNFPFSIQRLIAIYQILLSIIDYKEIKVKYPSIELICDIETLDSLNLIIPLKNSEIFIMKKYISGIGSDFALEIAEDFDIHLDDFIQYEKNI